MKFKFHSSKNLRVGEVNIKQKSLGGINDFERKTVF